MSEAADTSGEGAFGAAFVHTIVFLLLLVLTLGLVPSLSGCASSSSSAGDYYYSTGSIHRDSYPRAYGRGGYYGYGRPGRYRY